MKYTLIRRVKNDPNFRTVASVTASDDATMMMTTITEEVKQKTNAITMSGVLLIHVLYVP